MGVKVELSLFGWVPKVCGEVGLARFAVIGIDLFWTPKFGPLVPFGPLWTPFGPPLDP